MLKNCKEPHNLSNINLSYEKYGHGSSALLCFHGFGERGSKFAFLAPDFGNRYTIYSFDFLHHGNSLSDSSNFDKDVFTAFIKDFILKENLIKVNLMGFSMGGRMCLTLIEKIPDKINVVILLAPDGISDSFWFNFSTQTWAGNGVFKHFTNHPKGYFRIIRWLTSLRLISPKINQMIKLNTASEAQRKQVFNTWMKLSELKSNPITIEKILNEYEIKFSVIVGRYDKIISANKIKKWAWISKNLNHLHVVEQGHLISETVVIDKIKAEGLL